MKYILKDLPYAYDALEPFIDAKTMEIHHSKHHQAYINNLNIALEKYPKLNLTLEEMLVNPNAIPKDIQTAVQNNGGGHFNHNFFWSLLKVNHGKKPLDKLSEVILQKYQTFDAFKEAFGNAAKSRFGSGWAWLILNKEGKLEIISTANQDSPLPFGKPIIGLDVWEHAYYLNYQNRRPDYISAFFSIIDWEVALKNYQEAIK